MAVGSTKVVQVTNIAPQATKDQMQTLFGYLGKIEDIRLYPTIRDVAVPVQSRICYIKFHDHGCVSVAQHMTNTVFIDRALIVIPYQNGDIPDEQRALELTNNGTIVPGLYPSEPKLPANVVNAIEGIPPNHVITTVDPKLEASGLQTYPHLPGHLDSRRIEEIRRTLFIGNLDVSVTTEQLIEFFGNNNVEVKYGRMCTRESDTEHYALIELTEQTSIIPALKLNNEVLGDKSIKITHSTQAISKPEAKSNEAAQKEIEEAMSRVKEAHNLISAAIDPMIGGMLSKDKRSRSGSRGRKSRSRSRGRSRRSRSRKRSRSRHRRSRSRHRRRSRSRSKRRSRSKERRRKSQSRRRSSSRGRHRSRSRSRQRRSRSRRSRSRSKERKKKSPKRQRTRSRSRTPRSKRSKSRTRRSRSKSKSRSSKSKYSEKSRDKDKDHGRSKDKSESNGKKSDSDKSERSEKKSSRDKKSERESKSDDKSRADSEYRDSKERQGSSD
ncbi:probable splicing factor, arginine/serine-rich 7 [Leptopilina heterotoma]|uniref:probable splicing factor, arginine/serine-rich 7 n=1 Tax=Leptopilina heterotoma TaxID=63436 RepID=UPI001CA979AF|nr:probable splicing factor, arginine/serine-rich 7 [Leptopilina heterotoma]